HRRLEDVRGAENVGEAGVLRAGKVQGDGVARDGRRRRLRRDAGDVRLDGVHQHREGGGDVGRTEGRAVIELHVLPDRDLQVLATVLEAVGGRKPGVGAGGGRVDLIVLDQRLVYHSPT